MTCQHTLGSLEHHLCVPFGDKNVRTSVRNEEIETEGREKKGKSFAAVRSASSVSS
jgi:hypothetical protein